MKDGWNEEVEENEDWLGYIIRFFSFCDLLFSSIFIF